MLAYLNQVGGESDNLMFGADGFAHMSVEDEQAYIGAVSGKSVMLVGYIGGELASVASLKGMSGRAAHRAVLAISVRQRFWHRGVGTQMMNRLIEHARAVGIDVIELEVRSDNASAINLYQKMGFERIGCYRNFFRIGDRDYDADLMNLYLK
ncbi:MAG: GNAT family N-acetyltransferase [Clostridiales bacterium]|nr:GNAT family N-acetyltransferase [Clostridiales bacterium]